MDIYDLATDEEHDRILELMDMLPTHFYQDDEDWADIVKELHGLVIKLEKRSLA